MTDWRSELNQWIESMGYTKKRLANESGVNYSTLKELLNPKEGRIVSLSEERRNRLYNVTKLEILRDPLANEDRSGYLNVDLTDETDPRVIEIRALEKSRLDDIHKNVRLTAMLRGISATSEYLADVIGGKEVISRNSPGHERRVVDAFYNLIDALEEYKGLDDAQRTSLTSLIDSKDVGYMISYLNAIYKPDGFKEWVKMSGYKPYRPKFERDKK